MNAIRCASTLLLATIAIFMGGCGDKSPDTTTNPPNASITRPSPAPSSSSKFDAEVEKAKVRARLPPEDHLVDQAPEAILNRIHRDLYRTNYDIENPWPDKFDDQDRVQVWANVMDAINEALPLMPKWAASTDAPQWREMKFNEHGARMDLANVMAPAGVEEVTVCIVTDHPVAYFWFNPQRVTGMKMVHQRVDHPKFPRDFVLSKSTFALNAAKDSRVIGIRHDSPASSKGWWAVVPHDDNELQRLKALGIDSAKVEEL